MGEFLFLSDGRLFHKRDGAEPREIVSKFADEAMNRAMRIQQSVEWKTTGPGARFTGAQAAWALEGGDPAAMKVRMVGAAGCDGKGEFLYAMEMDRVGGLFAYDPRESYERRLFHRNNFLIRDLARSPDCERIAFSQEYGNGTANILTCLADGTRQKEITEGDSMDSAPSWVPGEDAVIFQSAGIGRNAEGYPMGLGPFGIVKIGLATGNLSTIIEDPGHDFLCPRADKDGGIYFIERPYEAPGARKVKPLRMAQDIVLLPFRLLMALFHFFNFFSMTYSGKPLTSAGGPLRDTDLKRLVLHGRMIDAERALKKAGKNDEHPSLVPGSWKLNRIDREGKRDIIAEGVISFDLTTDGGIVYTNGSGVFQIGPDGKRETICKGKLIEKVVAL